MFGMKSKIEKMFLFIGIFISVFFVLDVRGNNLMDKITELAKEERDLNKKITGMMTFELIEKQVSIAADSEKYLVKNAENELWLFKPNSIKEVGTAKMVSHIAQLLEINIPIIEEIILPVNGKKVFGSVQEIGFDDIVRFEKITIKELSPKKILTLLKLQVLDWLLVASRGEMTRHCFITSETKDEVLCVDQDDCFEDVNDGKILELGEEDWKRSVYTQVWRAYLEKELNVDFSELFKLINFIREVNDDEFKRILIFLHCERRKPFLKEVIWRKNNLENEFKKFYYNLAKKRSEKLPVILKKDQLNHLENVLQMKKQRVWIKRVEYKKVMNKQREEQKNIEIISARKIWAVISEWISDSCAELRTLLEDIKKLQIGEEPDFVECLVFELYIQQLSTKHKLNIHRIIKHPKRLNIIQIEHNLRTSNYDIFLNNNFSKMPIEVRSENILMHLRYINMMIMENKGEELISEYKQKMKVNSQKVIYQFLYTMAKAEYYYNPVLAKVKLANNVTLKSSLEEMDNLFLWKYYGFALCKHGGWKIKESIRESEKLINLSKGKDKEILYAAYIFMGFLYEHSGNDRFNKGFNVKKAITNYKKAIKIKPDSVEAHLNLGGLYLIKNLPGKALKEFKKVKELNPEYTQLSFHLAKIRDKNTYNNKEEYVNAIRMNTLSGRHHYIIGLAYLTKKDKKSAKKHFNKAEEFGYKVDVKLKEQWMDNE